MKEYIHENKLCFVIDEDGDSYESFQRTLAYIQNQIKPSVYEFKNPYWNGSDGYFIKDEIIYYLEYSNWTGTVLRVDENFTDFSKVRKLATEIYKEVNGKI
jgi:hypothetical protein